MGQRAGGVIGSDHHTAWANNTMLKRSGVDATLLENLPDAEKDTIGKLANGEPNGFVVDAGWDRVASKMPVPSPADMLKAAQSAVRYNNSLGITAWMDPAANAAPGEPVFALKTHRENRRRAAGLQGAVGSGQMSVHVAALLVANSKSVPADLDTLDKVRQQFKAFPT